MAVFWDIDKKKNLRHEISRKFKILQNLGKKMNIGDSEAFLGLQAIFRILRWKLNILKYWRYRWICQTGQTVLWLCCVFTELELDLSVNKCSIKCSISQYLQFLGRVQYFKNSFFSASDILNPTSKKFVKYMKYTSGNRLRINFWIWNIYCLKTFWSFVYSKKGVLSQKCFSHAQLDRQLRSLRVN